jgi:hypothetical protein
MACRQRATERRFAPGRQRCAAGPDFAAEVRMAVSLTPVRMAVEHHISRWEARMEASLTPARMAEGQAATTAECRYIFCYRLDTPR